MTSACNTPEQPEFTRLQYAFAGNIRDPEGTAPPADVDERRMAVYRELFYNNIEGVLANAFPVMHELLPETRWHELVRGFLIHHRARTPFFPRLPGEFAETLATLLKPSQDPAYLTELARYEWVEMELALSEQEAPPPFDPRLDIASARLAPSPLARRLVFRYPVHRIGPDFQPSEPEPTHLLVYRDREETVRFLEINPVTARLLGLLEADPQRPARDLLEDMARELGHPQPAAVIDGGLETLRDLLDRGVLEALSEHPRTEV